MILKTGKIDTSVDLPIEREQECLLRLKEVWVKVDDRKIILENISFQLAPREILTVIGPNGAGKTTLLKLVLGLLKPSSGSIRRRPGLRMGYLPQKISLNPSFPLTVERLLQMSRDPHQAQTSSRIDAVLKQVCMSRAQHQDIKTLSGGELQRVLLARALLENPHVLVLDEPVQGVDVVGQSELYALIASIRNELGCSVLLVSHDLHLVMSASDVVVCLNRHICCTGSPQHVSGSAAYRSLFGLSPYHHHHDHTHSHTL